MTRSTHRSRLPTAALALLALATGCVDVPDESPMGGEPMTDGAPPDMGLMPDGRMPDGPLPTDGDDPDAPEADGGSGGPEQLEDDGRPEDAEPGPAQAMPGMRYAEIDPDRCPDGGALLPGIAACAIVEPIDPLPTAVSGAAGVALSDGRILIAGGGIGIDSVATTETWLLDDDGWSEGPALLAPVDGAQATVRQGRVFVLGGHGAPDAATTVQVVALDGQAVRALMLRQRCESGFSAHRLGDERLVVVGGRDADGLAGAEEFEPLAQRPGAALASMNVSRFGHAGAVDADGALWVVGGEDRRGAIRFAPEVLEPDAGEWTTVRGPIGWAMTGGALAPTGDTILFAGGRDPDGGQLDRAGIYDREAGVWQAVGGLNMPQDQLRMAPLGDGGAVLALGAETLEIYDPIEAGFLRLRVAPAAWRIDPAVVAVDGQVVVVGGMSQGRVMARSYRVRLAPAEPPADVEEPGPEDEQGPEEEEPEGDDGDRPRAEEG